MAKAIRIQKRTVTVPPALIEKWRGDFAETMRLLLRPSLPDRNNNPGTGQVFIDGTFYELLFQDGTAEIRYQFLGPEISDWVIPRNLPMERWMISVFRAVKRHPTAKTWTQQRQLHFLRVSYRFM